MPRANTRRDYYEILDLGRDASEVEIKKAYRRGALKWHPDRNPGDHREAEERFKEVTEAYAVLVDPQKRAAYDRHGHAGVSSSAGGFDESIFTDFSDILGDMFGLDDLFGLGRGRQGGRRRGSDLRYDVEISFEEAARGLVTKIKLAREEGCADCRGSGARRGTKPAVCSSCNGHGQVRYQQGFLMVSRTCPQCRGAGRVVRDPCPECMGAGRRKRDRTIEIRIPPGVDNGTRLRIAGEGDTGVQGGAPGDLFVVLGVEEHAFFERRDADLFCSLPVSYPQAVLGSSLRVPTLDGDHKLKVPSGTQSGTVFRLRGKGLPRMGGGKGDLYVELRVDVPLKLDREQKQVIERLARILPVENRPVKQPGLLDRIKNIFG